MADVDPQPLIDTYRKAIEAGEDIIKAMKAWEGVIQNDGQLGDLAAVNTLSDAPVGNKSALQSALGFLNVWAGGTVNSVFPNSSLNDVAGVGSDIYFCNDSISDKPTAAYGACLHIKARVDRAYQLFMTGFNNPGPSTVYTRLLAPNDDGGYDAAPWGKILSNATTTDVLNAVAGGAEANKVGVYTFAQINNIPRWHGQTTSGANLIPAGVNATSIGTGDNGTPLTGTWRCMGRGAQDDVTLWLKVSD